MTETIYYTERVNLERVYYLLSIANTVRDVFFAKEKDKKKREQKIALCNKFLKQCIEKDGVIERVYDFPDTTTEMGNRLYTHGIQSLPGAIRGFLMKGDTTDIDMCNAHCKILYCLCQKYRVDCPELENYVLNRDYILKKFKSREDGKTTLLASMNSGEPLRSSIPYVKEFDAEMKRIQNTFFQNPDFELIKSSVPHDKRDSNYKGSLLNRILCSFENKILQKAIQFLKQNDYSICSLAFDGLLLYGHHYENTSLLQRLREFVHQETGFDIQWAFKEHSTEIQMPEGWKIPADINSILCDWDKILTPNGIAIKVLEILNADVYNLNLVNNELVLFHNLRWISGDTATSILSILISTTIFDKVKSSIYNDGVLESRIKDDYKRTLIRLCCSGGAVLKSIIKYVMGILEKDEDKPTPKFNNNPTLFGFKNGVWDLKTSLFRPYEYDDYMTIHCGYDYHPLDHDSAETKEIEGEIAEFFDSIMPNVEEQRFLLQFLASSLDGHWYDECLMMNGDGGNGKGVICNILRTVLGKYYKNADNSILKELVKGGSSMGEHIMDLMGKRMITFDEPSGINNDVLKKLTSTTDTLTARRLYGSNVEFTPNWTAFFLFNNPPEFNQDDTSNSIGRRLHDLFFPCNFTKDPSKVGFIEEKKGYTVQWKLANAKYGSSDWIEKIRDVVFVMLTQIWKKFEIDGRVVFTLPEIVKQNTLVMVGDLNPFSEILGFIKITTEQTEPIKAKDIWSRFICTEKYIHLSTRKKRLYPKKKMVEWLEQHQFLLKTINHQLWILNAVFINDDDEFGIDNEIVDEEIEVEEE